MNESTQTPILSQPIADLIKQAKDQPGAIVNYRVRPNPEVIKLAEQAAGELCPAPNCPHCYGRGYVGHDANGYVIVCNCMDQLHNDLNKRFYELLNEFNSRMANDATPVGDEQPVTDSPSAST